MDSSYNTDVEVAHVQEVMCDNTIDEEGDVESDSDDEQGGMLCQLIL